MIGQPDADGGDTRVTCDTLADERRSILIKALGTKEMTGRCSYRCDVLANGIYGCRWKKSDSDETSVAEKCWWWTFLLVFIFGVTALFCWAVFSNDYNNFNWYLYDNAGIWLSWGVLILSVFVIIIFYLTLLLCSGVTLIVKTGKRHLHLCHKIAIIFALCLFIACYVLVAKLWNEEYYAAVIALKMMGPWFHISLLVVVTSSSWLMFDEIMKIKKMSGWIAANVGVLILYLCVCFVPLLITSPCIGPDLESVQKPQIISHRLGTVKIAPENTILAFEEGDRYCESFAVETDVSISIDGVPFLMHDTKTIQRTTNVKAVFPNKANQRAEFFSWSELQQLNAGSWFLEADPFLTVATLSSEYKDKIRQQKIPTLGQIAKMLGHYSIIFDLYQPKYGHPYFLNYTQVALDALLNSGLPQSQVLWLPGYDRSTIAQKAPGFRMVATDSSIEYLKANNIAIVNLDFLENSPEHITNYISNNISIIQYVIQAPWLFSYAWCQGTTFVTTNDCKKLSQISNPIWSLSQGGYIALWVSMDLIFLVVLIAVFLFQYYRSSCRFLPWFSHRLVGSSEYAGVVNINLEMESTD